MSLNCLHNSPHYKLTMEFRLPTNLQTNLISYDPSLKALARQANTKPTKKSKYPLGNISHLIPVEIVSSAEQQQAIDYINTQAAPQRYKTFTHILPDNEGRRTAERVRAILYHYEQMWCAAWLPLDDQKDDYIYGYAFMFKDNAAANKMIPHWIMMSLDKLTSVTIGRTKYLTYSKQVTIDDIKINKHCDLDDLKHIKFWNPCSVAGYSAKGGTISREATQRFQTELLASHPRWEDEPRNFYRLINPPISEVIVDSADIQSLMNSEKASWLPSHENFISLIQEASTCVSLPLQYHSDLKAYGSIIHILVKPFFKKWIQAQCDLAIQIFNDPKETLLLRAKQTWRTLYKLCSSIYYVHNIWPDCPIDYYQTHLSQLLTVSNLRIPNTLTTEWLQKHMPVASFFKMLDKNHSEYIETKLNERNSYNVSHINGLRQIYFSSFTDTVDMLNNILNAIPDLAPPNRWRITEFHDYVQAESWKVRNPNECLPQDLFPEPIKTINDGVTWSFFQPNDTHQLASWGKAVHNCIGNATSYAEGVRKKKHFIVLCMLDNKPMFTILLEVNHGVMTVNQIVALANARLTDEQRAEYSLAFKKALQLRENQLVSA